MPVEVTVSETDIVATLVRDHREVEAMFEQVTKLPKSIASERREIVDKITIELVRHSVAEEEYLYPTVRDVVPGGAELADREIEEHAEVEKVLKKLDGLDADDPSFDQLIETLVNDVRKHVAEEEGELFPVLIQHADPALLESLGDKVRSAKQLAPTRPHPASPDHPPANKLLGPAVGLIDRMRDALTCRGKS